MKQLIPKHKGGSLFSRIFGRRNRGYEDIPVDTNAFQFDPSSIGQPELEAILQYEAPETEPMELIQQPVARPISNLTYRLRPVALSTNTSKTTDPYADVRGTDKDIYNLVYGPKTQASTPSSQQQRTNWLSKQIKPSSVINSARERAIRLKLYADLAVWQSPWGGRPAGSTASYPRVATQSNEDRIQQRFRL